MTAKELIKAGIAMSDNLVGAYLGDLSDADLTVQPVAGMNPIAWQLGHLIAGERMMIEMVQPNSCPPLPEGWDGVYGQGPKEGTVYPTKQEFLDAWKKQRAATLAVIDATPDAKLDEPSGVDYAPTVGQLLNLVGSHTVMHSGQWVAVRRKLNKPVTI